MQIGVPKEVKAQEYRVGLTPSGVSELTRRGHSVRVERGAGVAIGFDDASYRRAGASIHADAAAVWAAELVVKVKEPQPSEYAFLRADLTLFTYLHLAPDPQQADALLASGVTAIGYETVTESDGSLPLLAPMSEIAGRVAVQAGAHFLELNYGGRGVLLGGAAGVPGGKVLVLGGGTVGRHACAVALGLGAQVTVADLKPAVLRQVSEGFAGRAQTLYASRDAVLAAAAEADLIVGAVLLPGGAAPQLLSHDDLDALLPGAVLADVAIDQGGCFASSRPTTHADPIFIERGIVHYCVANIPGAVARTATQALTHATLPYLQQLAEHGVRSALREQAPLRAGLNTFAGEVTQAAVAQALNRRYRPATELLG